SKQLDALGLEYQYIDAVDGRQFTPYEVVEKYGEQVFYTNSYNKQRMTLGSIGCLLSHIKFYDLMIENNIPVACVLEDDAVISPRLPQILTSETLQKVPWGTLLLGHYSIHRKSFNKGAEAVYWRKKVCPGYYIARSAEFPFTTLGYLVKLSTAKRLRDLAFPIRMPADWVTGNTELTGATLRIITPPCIVSNEEYRVKSTTRGDPNNVIPLELQRETPTLSLRRYLTVGLANIVLGTRDQRAKAVFDGDKNPFTYSPQGWRLKQDGATEVDPNPDVVKKKSHGSLRHRSRLRSRLKKGIRKIKKGLNKRYSRRARMILKVIERRLTMQKTLWHRMKRIRSVRGLFPIGLRFVFNIPAIFITPAIYLLQDINRTIYYGRVLSVIRIYIKKIGLFKYTRII
ncbi:MAG: glycosyltransferase family 25 protein, partial [Gammaproteobacteria bacterium]|nr:glycosyltransferase family 25 protein [Gammaproteobacteria bacterium]